MTSNHLILPAAIGVLTLAAPLVAEPGVGDSQPLKPEIRFSDSTLEFALPDAMPRGTRMEVTILGSDDEVLVRETVAAPFFTWSPAGAPDGDYRYEARPLVPASEGEEWLGAPETGPRVRFRAGSFRWSDGRLVLPSAPAHVSEGNESPPSLDGPSQEADEAISDATPQLFFVDTDSTAPDFQISADSNTPYFRVVYGSAAVINLTVDAGLDTVNSLAVNPTGDVGLSEDTLFVDRSTGRVGIGTTVPTQELHVVSPDGGDIRLSGSAQGEEWDLGINSVNGSLNINDTTTAGNAVTIEMGTPEQTLRLNSAGRVGIGTPSPDAKLHVAGSGRIDGDVALGSSRTLKTSFGTVDSAEVLARVADLPLASWRYKSEDESTRHIGPFAEDFQRLFGLGDGETISVIDAQGVTLAAIQGLQQELAEKDEQLAELAARLAVLETQVVDGSGGHD